MRHINRRRFLIGSVGALLARPVFAQVGHAGHGDAYETLRAPGRIGLPEIAATQHVFDSPARKAATQGRWTARALLPLPRSEMAWAVEMDGKMHVLGGYAQQRVARSWAVACKAPCTRRSLWARRRPATCAVR